MECLGLYNKSKVEVHPGHKLTGLKQEEESVEANSVTSTGRSLRIVVSANYDSTTSRTPTHTDFTVFGLHYIRI